MSEFGFRDGQMRTPFTVKNASVFEVKDCDRNVEQILFHGDVNDDDILNLMISGRHFFIMPEDSFTQKWQKVWTNSWEIDVDEFAKCARIIINNGEMFKFNSHRDLIFECRF